MHNKSISLIGALKQKAKDVKDGYRIIADSEEPCETYMDGAKGYGKSMMDTMHPRFRRKNDDALNNAIKGKR